MNNNAVETHYHREGEVFLVELQVNALDELFDTLDPAPLRQRTVQQEAEDYIIACVRDLPPRGSLKLVLYLPEQIERTVSAVVLVGALRNHFAYRAASSRTALQQILRQGRLSLLIGMLFLFTCVGLRELLVPHPASWSARILYEGFYLLGWVAMWRPLQIFLYDWWPLLGEYWLFRRLEQSEIMIRPVPPLALVPVEPAALAELPAAG